MIKELITDEMPFGKRAPSFALRVANIEWVRQLPREGYVYEQREAKLNFCVVNDEELLTVDYPGKESVMSVPKKYDFRPRLFRKSQGLVPDLSFFDIWDSIVQNLQKSDAETCQLLAVLFYRMVHMVDVVPTERDWQIESQGVISLVPRTSLPALYQYRLPSPVQVHATLGGVTWCGMSIDAFMQYNFLLALNEDVKYSYLAEQNGKKWDGAVGMRNTLLTHLSVIGFAAHHFAFADILQRFVKGRGVGPASGPDIRRVLGDYLRPRA